MASKPGVLTEWPWTHLGKFKYVVLAPWVADIIYSYFIASSLNDQSRRRARDITYFLYLLFLLVRVIHHQIWISLARFRTAKSKNRILDKPIEFEQVDRESNWDDQVILNGILFYLAYQCLPGARHFPIWRTDGVVISILLHMGPVEFLYYWLHRALHHHFLYSRYHSHHHSSIVTQPISAVCHPFGEHLMYFVLFTIPLATIMFTETASIVAIAGYLIYVDFMNNMGHCNFEFVPISLFNSIPFLKYIFYTPSYHSLHHTQFRTNYSLFMPIYDYVYGTLDKSSDLVYENALKRRDESPDVVHLTHPTTTDSIYHLRLGFASLASQPYNTDKIWYLIMIKWLLWPFTCLWRFLFNRVFSYTTFVLERNTFYNNYDDGRGKVLLKMQTWVVPRYSYQYSNLQSERGVTNSLVEEAILDAERAGVKVLSLGLLNQGEELNKNGEVYIEKHPKLKIRVVDGSRLAIALVVNSSIIPKGTRQVIFRGKLTKVGYGIALSLCQRGLQVVTIERDEFEKLKLWFITTRLFGNNITNNLIHSSLTSNVQDHHPQVWLVGDGFREEEEKNAPTGTLFIPFSQFPPWITNNTTSNYKVLRKDCVYYNTPAMVAPPALENMHSCENWLPRRAMSAWRVAGIVHALEEWDTHECGNSSLLLEEDVNKVWVAALRHGFRPLDVPVATA